MDRRFAVVAVCALMLGSACDNAAAPAADAAVGETTGAETTGGTDAQPTADVAIAQDTPRAGQDAVALADQAVAADVAPIADVPAAEVATPDAKQPTGPYPSELKMQLGTWVMQPKAETTRCMVKRLDNPDEVWVHEIQTVLAKGSHHLIVYRSDATEEVLVPVKCTPFTETLSGGNIPLMITQIPKETLTLPKGVAFKFAPKQMIRIEAHYLNYYSDPIDTGADIKFVTLPPAEVKDEADMLFYGTPDFSLKPGKPYSTPWNYIDVWKDTKVFAVTGHTHQYGTNVEIGLAQGGTNVDAPLIYPGKDKPFDWAEAPLQQFDPPLQFKGNEGFQYRCSWLNTSNKQVGFGESANQEMCFFWAYYYPSKGYRMCINPGKWKNQAPDMITDPICCPDSPICGLIKSYLGSGQFGGG